VSSATQVWHVCKVRGHVGKGPDGAYGENGWKHHITWCKSRAAKAARKSDKASPKGDVVKETFVPADGAQRGPSEKASTRRVTVAENNAKASEVISLTEVAKLVTAQAQVLQALTATVGTLTAEVKDLRSGVSRTLSLAASIELFQQYLADSEASVEVS